MKRVWPFIFLGVALLNLHCDEECDCIAGPYYGELQVKLTINDENSELWLTIFEGKIEAQDTLFYEAVTEDRVYYELEAGRYYSATVSYTKGARTIIAVDGKKMHVNSDDCNCDYAQNITLNLKLAK